MRIVTAEQYDDAWWEARRGVPTASEAGRILTPGGKPSSSKSTGQSSYIAQLIGERYDPAYPRVNTYQSPAMKNGSLREGEARAWYEFSRGVELTQAGLCLDESGRFGFSPDSLLLPYGDWDGKTLPAHVHPEGVIELKNPTHEKHALWLLGGKVPDEHVPQVHFILAASDCEWVDFVSYATGMKELTVRVTPNDYTAAMRKQMEVFWKDYQAALQLIRDMSPPTAFLDHKDEQALAEVF